MNNRTVLATAFAVGVMTISGTVSDYGTISTSADSTKYQSLLEAKRYVLGADGTDGSAYDANGDGTVDVLDILQMKRETIEEASNGSTYVTPFADGTVCTIRNVGSGKYLNVDYGADEDGTNVYQWTGDGSTEQTFKMDALSEGDGYRLRAMCSSDGGDKTLDVVKSNGNVVSDCNVEIYSPIDRVAQEWLFVSLGDGTYRIVPKYSQGLSLTAYGDANGSSEGTTATSSGNVFVSTDIGSDYQRWVVTIVDSTDTTTTTVTTPAETTVTTTTTPPTTTTPEPTTTTTTTTTPEPTVTLPTKAYISGVTPIVQTGLPTGCEATGLTIALNWYGFNVTKEEVALTYMPRQDFYYADGKKVGADYMTTFAGDPTRKSNSYGCYIPCMVKTVQNYFDAIGETEYTPVDITGTELDDLFQYVANGTPVILISTNNLVTPTTGDSWYTEDGTKVTWQKGHHCMVLTGYDYKTNTVTVSESAYSYERTYDMDTFRSVYNQKGKYAMVLSKKGSSVTGTTNYVTPFEDGGVYTIKNVGSGKYLNVDYGTDEDGTNVYQWSGDGSTEQTFRMDLLSSGACYRVRAMCSSDGTDKTLDIVKSNGNVVSGCNVEIYSPVDQIAQDWLFVSLGNGTYRVVPKYNTSLSLTVYGNANGSADGTTETSTGNVFVSEDTGSAYQKWVITKVG